MVPGKEGVADTARGDAGASQAAVAGTGQTDADLSMNVAHDCGQRVLPFVSKFLSNNFEERMGFLTKETISGCYKRCKVTTLLLAGFEIMAFLLRLLGT